MPKADHIIPVREMLKIAKVYKYQPHLFAQYDVWHFVKPGYKTLVYTGDELGELPAIIFIATLDCNEKETYGSSPTQP